MRSTNRRPRSSQPRPVRVVTQPPRRLDSAFVDAALTRFKNYEIAALWMVPPSKASRWLSRGVPRTRGVELAVKLASMLPNYRGPLFEDGQL